MVVWNYTKRRINGREINMVDILDYVKERKEKIKEEVSKFDRKPKLVVVQIGNDNASSSYVKSKNKLCDEVDVDFKHIHIKEDMSERDVLLTILDESGNSEVDGIILQLPVPDKYNLERLQKAIYLEKDVDGFSESSNFTPCTPKGIIDWLDYNKCELEGKSVTVIGRSKIVGKPLVNLLIDRGATVTCCNSKTKDLRQYTFNSDIVISAVGKAKFLDSSYFTNTKLVIDVGINRDENGKLCGDVNREEVMNNLENNIYVTPVPNGVGRLTVLSLIENTIEAYKDKRKLFS